MLWEEVAKYTELSGNDGEHTPISVIGAYLDGYDKGRRTLINDVKAEIEKQIKRDFAFSETETLKVPCHYGTANGLQVALRILENIGKTECEDKING